MYTHNGNGKVHPITSHEDPEGVKVYLYSFFNLGARWGGCAKPRLGRFTPGRDPVAIIENAGWAPGPVRTGAEKFTPTGIRSPDRPAHSKSLYQLSYPCIDKIQQDATVCRYLFTASLLYSFRASIAPIIRSTKNYNRSLWYRS